jgi:DNA-directed RNA polymerase specialized sigma24 family protein
LARVADEDVGFSAFDSFARSIEQGRFPQLEDRDDLWHILVMLTRRKAADQIRHEQHPRRAHRPVEAHGSFLRELVSQEFDPAFAAEVAEECQVLLERLKNDELRQIAMSKLEGFTNNEIAARLKMALSTLERRLALIRKAWTSDI